MSKDEFKQELEKHNLNVNEFLDLRDSWNCLHTSDKLELLKEDMVSKGE